MAYEEDIKKAEAFLTGLSESGRKKVATLLVLASYWGSGDAFAGLQLKVVPHSFIEEVCKALKIEPVPKSGGINGSLSILSGRSSISEVEKLLTILDRSATAGRNPAWEADWAQTRAAI